MITDGSKPYLFARMRRAGSTRSSPSVFPPLRRGHHRRGSGRHLRGTRTRALGQERRARPREGPRDRQAQLPRSAADLRRLQDVRHHDGLGRSRRLLGRQAHADHRGRRVARRLCATRGARGAARLRGRSVARVRRHHRGPRPRPGHRGPARARGDAGRDEAHPHEHPAPRHRALARGTRRHAGVAPGAGRHRPHRHGGGAHPGR